MKIKFIPFILMGLPLISHAQIVDKQAQATFGRYGLDCSSGRGACSFSSTKLNAAINGKTASKLNDNTFVLTISCNTLSNEDQVKIAGKPFNEFKDNETVLFVQDQMLRLDEGTLQTLDINKIYSELKPGKYKMTITQDQVQIFLTLTESK